MRLILSGKGCISEVYYGFKIQEQFFKFLKDNEIKIKEIEIIHK